MFSIKRQLTLSATVFLLAVFLSKVCLATGNTKKRKASLEIFDQKSDKKSKMMQHSIIRISNKKPCRFRVKQPVYSDGYEAGDEGDQSDLPDHPFIDYVESEDEMSMTIAVEKKSFDIKLSSSKNLSSKKRKQHFEE